MSTYNDASLIYYPSGYKASKAYSLKPTDGSGDLTFTRASTATRVNESGLIESVATGVPRIDYTGAGCAKLLLEPQRTNLIFQSINFASWSRIGTPTVTSNYGISPSGIQDSTRVQGINGDRLYLAATGSSATYSYSIYVKGSGLLSLTDSTGSYYLIITPTSNWVRHTLNFTAGFTNVQIRTLAVSDLEIYGAQIESGAYPTSLINTAGTAVTRVQDIFSRSNVFTNGLITASGGTWFTELKNNFVYTGGINQAQLLGLGNNAVGASANNFFIACTSGTRVRVWKQIAGTLTSLFVTTTDTAKIAIRWNGVTADIFVNGVKVVTSTAFTETALQSLRTIATEHPYNIQSTMLFPSPKSDADLLALTTL